MRTKAIFASLLVLALAGSACAKKETTSTPSGAKGHTYTVQIDSKKPGQSLNQATLAYYPNELKAHAGDTIEFKLNWSGEPHTVTMGTLVDAGMSKLDPKAQDEPAEWKKWPVMLPEGPGDADPVSTNPCYVETGDPTKDTCKTQQPEFNGKWSAYSSGFIPDGGAFKVKLASDVAAGTYSFFCTLHRGAMTGKIVVVDKAEKTPTPADVLKQGDAAIADIVGKMEQAAKNTPPGQAFAGFGSPDLETAMINEMLPKDRTAKVGEAVSWGVIGPHTISINPTQDAVELITKAADGFHLNPKVLGPSQAPPAAPEKETGNVVDAGTWNGEGFLNSGFLPGFGPPGFLSWQVKFGKAGTYKYQCLIHPDMEGTVTVA